MNQKDVMQKISAANKAVTAGVDKKDIRHWVNIYVMGKEYKVPADLTIMQAMEYSGYRFIRSCGCRAGFCGACATVYKTKDDSELKCDMACQTRVEDEMYLVQIPFSPAKKADYNIDEEKLSCDIFIKYYPEIARCFCCNTCTKTCPQSLEVMDYIQAALRGDFEKASELSFDCIQCGLCASRCPAEIVHYHVAQLARRLYGKFGLKEESNLAQRVKEIKEGKFGEGFKKVLAMDSEDLKKAYKEQQQTKEVY